MKEEGEGKGGRKVVVMTLVAVLVFLILICLVLLMLYYFYYPMGRSGDMSMTPYVQHMSSFSVHSDCCVLCGCQYRAVPPAVSLCCPHPPHKGHQVRVE